MVEKLDYDMLPARKKAIGWWFDQRNQTDSDNLKSVCFQTT